MIDLHIHTTASSDGQHTPSEIFEMAARIGLRAIAFADHNTVASLDEGMTLSKKYDIEFVPAIELNTIHEDLDLHLLSYYMDYKDPSFIVWLDEINMKKIEQGRQRAVKLKQIGFIFDWEDVERLAKGQIPSGATFLKAILGRKENKGSPLVRPYIDGERSDSPSLNFYLDYLRGGSPASVPLDGCDTVSSVRKVIYFGGVPVLAHPSDTPVRYIEQLIAEGLAGLEAYSSRHSPAECESFRLLAEKHGILYTTGSDFHGKLIKPNVELGRVDMNSYEVLKRIKDYKLAMK